MAGLDAETRDMVLSTLLRYAERRLTDDYLLEIDKKDEFPKEVLEELFDPMQFGLHLLFIPEEYGGLDGGAYDIYRVLRGHGRDRSRHRHWGVGDVPGH